MNCLVSASLPCIQCVAIHLAASSSLSSRNLYCGNGVTEKIFGEQCDDGQKNGTPASICSRTCTLPARCGDAAVQNNEECDDGASNGTPASLCTNDCRLVPGVTPACGDGSLQRGEDCDHGARNGAPGDDCSLHCTFLHFCGNGRLDPGETCDDGSSSGTPSSLCSATCDLLSAPASLCGNGTLDPGEECDDHNAFDHDGCSRTCTLDSGITPFCGDRIIERGEQCDDGPQNSDVLPDHCRTNCLLAHCGDSVTDQGEQCDSTSVCGVSCRFLPLSAQVAPTVINLGPLVVPYGGSVTQIALGHAPQGKTGPEVVVVMVSGAAAGWAWMRRRRRN